MPDKIAPTQPTEGANETEEAQKVAELKTHGEVEAEDDLPRDKKKKRKSTSAKLDLQKAILHRKMHTINWGPARDFMPYSIYKFPIKLFYEYGIGMYLFFEFTVMTCMLCFGLAALCLPIYMSAWNDGRIQPEIVPFEQFSYGNLGEEVSAYHSLMQYFSSNQWAFFNAVCILIFSLYLFWTDHRITKKADEQDNDTITTSDFTIKVTGLPKQEEDKAYMKDFFEENWGEVSDIAISFNDGEVVEQYCQLGLLLHKLKADEQILKDAESKKIKAKKTKAIAKLTEKIDKSINT